jgi:hypothetical protein
MRARSRTLAHALRSHTHGTHARARSRTLFTHTLMARTHARTHASTRVAAGGIHHQRRWIRPEPHLRHSSHHPAPSWVSARRSSILRAAQPHIRHFVPWPALRASSELVLPSTSRPAQQTCPSACPCPGSSPITRRVANLADPGGGLNRPACARPVADAALYCAQQGCGGILIAAGLCS